MGARLRQAQEQMARELKEARDKAEREKRRRALADAEEALRRAEEERRRAEEQARKEAELREQERRAREQMRRLGDKGRREDRPRRSHASDESSSSGNDPYRQRGGFSSDSDFPTKGRKGEDESDEEEIRRRE